MIIPGTSTIPTIATSCCAYQSHNRTSVIEQVCFPIISKKVSMLSGIKKGKRKKRKLENSLDNQGTEASKNKPSASSQTSTDNHDAAEELRRMLSGGEATKPPSPPSADAKLNSSFTVIDRFEQRRGKLQDAVIDSNSSEKVVLMSSNKAPTVQKEDFRNGARKGKVKQQESYLHTDKDKSLAELVAEEKKSQQQGSRSMDEEFARNIARLGSRYKGAEFKSAAGASAGADEDDMAGDGGIDMKMFTSNEDRLTGAAKYNREISRQMALANKEEKITSRCSWWMESSSFQKHRLLSLGDHLSLVFVPSHYALVSSQLYLVPVKVRVRGENPLRSFYIEHWSMHSGKMIKL